MQSADGTVSWVSRKCGVCFLRALTCPASSCP
jgi:hypothetical protein